MKEDPVYKLTSNKLLTRNVILNFLAQGLPLIIAIFTIPWIIKGMGVDKFSILTLIWIIIGYSNLFDFGLGRALTQLISKKLAQNDTEDIPDLIWTTLIVVIIFGILATIIIWILTPTIITKLLKIPEALVIESEYSLYALALTLPLLLLIVNIKGILEAYQEFIYVSLLRIPVVIFNYIGPLFVLPFSNNLYHIVILLVAGRIITFFLHVWACSKVVNNLTFKVTFNKTFLKPLFSFGGWITVSNVIGPLTSYMDRFFIAYFLSALIVAYYTTPFDVISRLSIIPLALMGVMFPAFSAEYQMNKARTRKLFIKTLTYTVLLLLFPVILIFIFAKPGLTIWLDSDFADKSYLITQILAIGILIEGINQSSIALIQGTGRSDVTGKIILAVLPVYLVILYFFIELHGLIGAAFAWLIRAVLDCVLLNFFAFKLLKPDNN
ncbi:MAG: flippase [Cyanobacteriota bacterium]